MDVSPAEPTMLSSNDAATFGSTSRLIALFAVSKSPSSSATSTVQYNRIADAVLPPMLSSSRMQFCSASVLHFLPWASDNSSIYASTSGMMETRSISSEQAMDRLSKIASSTSITFFTGILPPINYSSSMETVPFATKSSPQYISSVALP